MKSSLITTIILFSDLFAQFPYKEKLNMNVVEKTKFICFIILIAITFSSCSAFSSVKNVEPTKPSPPEKIFLKRTNDQKINSDIIAAWKLYQSGNYKKAASEFEKIIDSGIVHYDLYYGAGLSFMKYYNNEKAIKYLSLTIKIEPNHFEAIFYRASIYREIQNFQDARRDYERILSMKSSKPLVCGSYNTDLCSIPELERRKKDSKRIIKML